jgi:hypothetical protein
MNPHNYTNLIFDKDAKTIEKRQLLQQMLLRKVVICLHITLY